MESTAKSQLSVLRRQLLVILKNPEIDFKLDEILSKFIKILIDSQDYLGNGVCNFNFLEASILLQNSTEMYGKKVDLLMQKTQNFLSEMISYEEKKEIKQQQNHSQSSELSPTMVEEEKLSLKRISKKTSNAKKKVKNFSFVNDNIRDYLSSTFKINNLENVWKTFSYNSLIVKTIINPLNDRNVTTLFEPNEIVSSLDGNDHLVRYDQLNSCEVIKNIIYCPDKLNINQMLVSNPTNNNNDIITNKIVSSVEYVSSSVDLPFNGCDSILHEDDNEILLRNTNCSKNITLPSIQTQIPEQDVNEIPLSAIVKTSSRKRIFFGLNKEDLKRRKKSKNESVKYLEKPLVKLLTGISVNLNKFETFYRREYKIAEEEGIAIEVENLDVEMINDTDSDHIDDFRLDESLNMNCSKNTSILTNLESTTISKTSIEGDSFNSKEILQGTQIELDGNAIEREISKKNISEWRQFIIPKLKDLNNDSGDFDINHYSTKIINSSEIDEKIAFKDLVKGMKPREVSKYFVAALQLANTNKIEMQGVQNGKVSNKTFQIKILSNKKSRPSTSFTSSPKRYKT